jgi:hypothetical protein
MDAPKTATARFQPAAQNVAVSISGEGLVVSDPSGISCPGNCTASFRNGATVTLQASGAAQVCGNNLLCELSVLNDLSATATFGTFPNLIFANGFE